MCVSDEKKERFRNSLRTVKCANVNLDEPNRVFGYIVFLGLCRKKLGTAKRFTEGKKCMHGKFSHAEIRYISLALDM